MSDYYAIGLFAEPLPGKVHMQGRPSDVVPVNFSASLCPSCPHVHLVISVGGVNVDVALTLDEVETIRAALDNPSLPVEI